MMNQLYFPDEAIKILIWKQPLECDLPSEKALGMNQLTLRWLNNILIFFFNLGYSNIKL